MSSTQLATVDKNEVIFVEGPAGMGQNEEIAAIRKRIVQMMPGAADAPSDVQWAAAQLAVAHKLNPFNGEIYVMKIGSKKVDNQWVDDWRAHVGVKGLRKLARVQSEFMTEARVMDASEVRAQRRGDYDPEDVGVEMTMWRLDVAERCSRINIPYRPVKSYGFWRVKAQYNKKYKKWEPDGIPNTWTAQMVAEKRAEINAIKQAFDMQIDVADPSQERTIDELHYEVKKMDRDEAPMLRKQIAAEQYDDDGELLYATPTPERQRPQRDDDEPIEGEYTDADLDAAVEGAEEDDSAAVPPFKLDKQFWPQLDNKLTEKQSAFVGWVRLKQMEEGGPASADEITAIYDYIQTSGVEPTGLNSMLDYLINAESEPSAAVHTALVGNPLKKTQSNSPGHIKSIWQKMRDFEQSAA